MTDLDSLAARLWDLSLENSPSTATLLGDRRFDHLLDDLSPEGMDRYTGQLRELVAAAAQLDESEFDSQEHLTRDMLLSVAADTITMIETKVLIGACDPLTGPLSSLLNLVSQTRAQDAIQAEALYTRYQQVPRLLAETLALHQTEAEAGRTPIAANVQRVISVIDDYLGSPLESDPFAEMAGPEDWDGLKGWQQRMRSLAAEKIRPAVAGYREGVVGLLEVSRDQDHSGLCHIAGGEEIYEKMIALFTTLPYTADDLHGIGMSQAKGIHADEFRQIGERALGTADLAEILSRLRNDQSLRYETAEEIVQHARDIVERSWEAATNWFNLRPIGTCAVVEIPPYLAKNAPPAYYFPPASDGSRSGTYFINTHEPTTKVRYAAEAVAFHEANPGHHFQLTLASELKNIPEFRKHSQATAYVEGWGLYAERLADEMNLYTGDTDLLGMVSADAWRAGRLVVDTGVHAFGWTRRQSVEFLQQWTAIDQPAIETEVDRYIGVPGQALAYKVGQMEIFRLRAEAQETLGPRFDIRGFHDTVLGSGALTLPLLGGLVSAWVKAT
jgi:uncharacterized protein (DUF885 family)